MALAKKKLAFIISASAILALGVTVNIVAATGFSELLNTVLGGPRAILAKNEGGALYEKTTSSKKQAKEEAQKLTEEIVGEGIVLLKNENNALPLEGIKISVFGKNSANIIYGTSGSGEGNKADNIALYDALKDGGYELNPKLTEFYSSNKSGEGRSANPAIENSGVATLKTGETPISSYTSDIESSYDQYNDAAIIYFARIAGEGFDLPMAPGEDKHYLQLDDNEAALIKYVASKNFKHIIVYINSNNPFEVGFLDDPNHYGYSEKIDAAMWSGGFGSTGVRALPRILKGEITPSGHLVDTFARNFKEDPVYQNFGNNCYKDGDAYTLDGKPTDYHFVDYEENIYVGYKYWETRGIDEGEDWYEEHVVYPFGYGLSYAEFDWNVKNASTLESTKIAKGEKINVEVEVTNKSSKFSGKDVVQVYAEVPYIDGEIEKPYVQLAGFAKTRLLKPGESETVTIEVDPYYFASFDYLDANGNGTSTFELDAGEYYLNIAKNAHEFVTTVQLADLDETIIYDVDPVTGTEINPLFEDTDDLLVESLSRTDWEGTFPASRTDEEKDIDYWLAQGIDLNELWKSRESGNPISVTEAPIQGKQTGSVKYTGKDENGNDVELERPYKLSDLSGAEWDDPRWEDLLNQIPVTDLANLFNHANFKTVGIDAIKKPKTNDTDGPSGFTNFMDTSTFKGTCSYCNQIVVSATWNQELSEKMGLSIGEEGLWGNADGDGLPYSGWYAPGMNIHRGQFGGRVAEYYSEDSILTGKMATALIKGCRAKGVYPMIKHFALNEQETSRAAQGGNSWVNEQAMREIYLRPFEMAVKEGKATAVMSSFNRIGTTWAGGDYRLLTTVLREEWGFHGTVISDFNTHPEYMDVYQMAYAGGNLNLATMEPWFDEKTTNPNDITVLRELAKGTLYTVANSNACNAEVLGYQNPLWMNIMFIIDGVIGAALIAWGLLVFIPFKKKPHVGEEK